MRITFLILFLLGLAPYASAQLVTIYNSDFGSLPDGSTSGNGWSASGSDCDGQATSRYGVFGGRFTWRDMEGSCGCGDGGSTDNVFEVGPIEISGCNVTAIVSVGGSGSFECDSPGGPDFSCNNSHDQLVIEYSVDGGSYTQFPNGYVCGGTNLGAKTISGISGNTLSIRVTGGNKAQDETYFINSVTIRGTANATVTTSGPNAVCAGGSINISASGGFDDYIWSNGESGQTIPITAPGAYRVTATSAGGCQATATKNVVLAPAPVVTITGTTQLCFGGTGNLAASTGFSSYEWSTGDNSQTINIDAPGTYIVTVTDAAGCIGTRSFMVREATPPNVILNTTAGRTSVCSGTPLTISAAGAGITSYSWSNGAASSSISVTQGGTYTLTVTNAFGCEREASIDIEEFMRPTLIRPNVQNACGAYELPPINGTNLTGNEAYYTGPNGTGQSFLPGEEITNSGLVYIFDGEPGCTAQQSFAVVITPEPDVADISNQTACDFYVLPDITGTGLTASRAYFTGSNGTGTRFNIGDTIRTNRNLFIYDGTATCNDQESFSITILQGPRVNDLRDTSICSSYTLPPITGTNITPGTSAYYTGSATTGIRYNPGDRITTSQTLFIYNGTATCFQEQSFNVTITSGPLIDPISDTVICTNYTLPPISGTNLSGNQAYYTASGGTGTRLNPGDVVTSSQTLFAYDNDGNCSHEESFLVTIATSPVVNDLPDVSECSFYILPNISGSNLTGNQAFYTQSGGAGTRLNSGDTIKNTITLFIYDGAPGCNAQENFTITILPAPEPTPLADQTACAFYILPNIMGNNLSANAAYFTSPNGMGTRLIPGDTIFSSGTYFIFDNDGTCSGETTIRVDILPVPVINAIADLSACGQLALPSILGSNLSVNAAYFSQPNGRGTRYLPGDTLTANTVLYAFDQTGTCSAEDTFAVTIYVIPSITIRSNNVTCNGGQNGTLEVVVVGTAPPFRFDWNVNTLDGQQNVMNVAAGNYVVVVADTNNCRALASVTITQPAPLELNCLAESPASTPSAADGSARIILTNGTAPFTLNWSGAATGNLAINQIDTVLLNNLATGTYNLTLTDANGCTANCSFTIGALGCNISLNLAATDASCMLANDGAITSSIAGAVSPIRYDWNVDSLDGNPNPTGLLPGTYTLSAIDSNSCIVTENVQIGTRFPLPDATIAYNSVACEDECFSFDVTLTGTPPFELDYQLSTNIGAVFRTINFNSNRDTIEVCPANFNTTDGNIIIEFLRLRDANCENQLDRLDTLLVNPHTRDTILTTICTTDSLLVNGTVYNTTNPGGTEILRGAAANGCDSIITVELTFYPLAVFDVNPTICETDSVLVNGTVYNFNNPNGTETLIGAASNGCDSIININLQFFPSITFDLNSTICETDRVIVNGTVYNFNNPIGTETLIGAAANGCDSIVNINLQFFPSITFDLNSTICETDSVIVNGTVYNFNNPIGTETLIGAAANGCDSIVSINLQFFPSVTFDLNSTICETDSVTVNGTVYNFSNSNGTETLIGAAANGCDSIVNINLQFFPSVTFDLNSTICETDSVVVNGRAYNLANPNGTETLIGASANGCDSIVNIRLQFINTSTFDLVQTICETDSIVVNGSVYNQANPTGTEIFIGGSASGCDSLVNINLSIFPLAVFDLDSTLCEGDSVVVNGTIYNQSNPTGIEVLRVSSVNGCDSTINIRLTFLQIARTNLDTTLCPGEQIQVNGMAYDVNNPSGTEVIPGGAANGCDSIIQVQVQFFEPAVFDLNPTLCETDSIVVNGVVYNFNNSNGTETLVGASVNGCDSIVNINLNFYSTATFDLNQTLCEGDSLAVNGMVYNQNRPSGTAILIGASANGCDSIVNISLSFLPPARFDLAPTICETDSIVVNGTVYNFMNPNGTETLIGAATNGCDSIVNISLNFYSTATFDLNQTLCEGDSLAVNGIVYNQNRPGGTEILIGASANGCDSIVNINLTFLPTVRNVIDTILCPGESLLVNGVTYDENRLSGTEIIRGGASTGCDSIVQVNVRYRPAVTGSIIGDALICAGDSTPLTFRLSGAPIFDLQYSDGANTFNLNNISDQFTVQVAPSQTSTYTITFLSVDGQACPAQLSGSAVVRVSNLSAQATVVSNYIGADVSCAGAADGVIRAEGLNGVAPFAYRWSTGATAAQVNGEAAGTYAVTLTDAAGCTAIDSIALTEPEPIVVSHRTRSPVCATDRNGFILLDSLSGGVAPFEVSLNGTSYRAVNSIPFEISNLSAGNYTVYLRDANDCETTFSTAILAPSEPQVNLGPDITLKLGDSIELVGLTNFEPTQIEWKPTDFLSAPNALRTFVNVPFTTTYTIRVADTSGCSATDQITVFLDRSRNVFIPTAFTPDGDGVNDFFFVNGGNDVLAIKELRIFDRWGNLMFRRGAFMPNDPQLGWDGNFNGRKVNQGVYVYYCEIEFIDGKVEVFEGGITVVR